MVPIEISTARYVFNSRLSSRYLISTNILPSLRYRTYSSQPSSPGVRYQEQYKSPRLPIVFAHGLFGFDELSFAPARFRDSFPQLSIAYWRGVSVLLRERGVDLHVAKVPMSASIEERAQALRQVIDSKFAGRDVNVIGHSMGGLDARFLLSRLSCKAKIRSLTTIATPHRGSPFADFMLDNVIGRHRLPHLLKLLQRLGLPGGGRAFECLTTTEMSRFNRETPDNPQANYLSWGAAFKPGMFNEFYYPHRVIAGVEGENDGLVSVSSSQWGSYQGTLHASHLDLIGWTRKASNIRATLFKSDPPFDARAFYLTLCEDLALLGC